MSLIKIELLVPLLVIISLIQRLGFSDTALDILVSFTNPLAIILTIMSCKNNIRVTTANTTVVLAIVLMCVYLINLLLSPYASPKWTLNTFFFILLFVALSRSIETIKPKEILATTLNIDRFFSVFIVFLSILVANCLFKHAGDIIDFWVSTGDSNSIMSFLYQDFGINKQGFGNLAIILSTWVYLRWKSLNKSLKLIFICFGILSTPFLLSSRTIILTFILSVLFLKAHKIILTAILLFVSFCVAFFKENILFLIINSYDRSTSMLFALSSVNKYPFGLGNGGYHTYVTNNSSEVSSYITALGTEDQVKDFWLSPESDYAYFIASFGLLSIVFFGICFFLIIQTRFILRSHNPSDLDKFFLISMFNLVFAGLSQFNASSIIWWLHFALAFGIIRKYTRNVEVDLGVDNGYLQNAEK